MPELDIHEWIKQRTVHLLRSRQQKILSDSLGGDGGVSRFLKEGSRPNPELATINEMAKALGVSLFEFFGAPAPVPYSELVEDLKFILSKTQDRETLLPIKFVIENTARAVTDKERKKLRRKGTPSVREKPSLPKKASG